MGRPNSRFHTAADGRVRFLARAGGSTLFLTPDKAVLPLDASALIADNTDTVGVYSPSNGFFYLRNTNTPGVADLVFGYGPPNVSPLVGDWNGV